MASVPAAGTGPLFAEMAVPVRPRDVNPIGTVFGGLVMDLVDRVAAHAASAFCGRPVVTAALDRMDFLAGIQTHQLIRLRASGNRTFRTSLEVGVEVEGEDPTTGHRWPTSHAIVTAVALGDDGRPTPVPPLVPRTPDEQARWNAAGLRRGRRRRALGRPGPDYDAVGPESSRHLAFELSTQIVMPEHVNELEMVAAGWLLAELDKLGSITALRHAARPVVTASVSALSFGRPVRVGEVVLFRSFLTRTFHTSMEVQGEVWSRSPYGGQPEHVSTAHLTFVALDAGGRPAPVPPLEPPRTGLERRLWRDAAQRRARHGGSVGRGGR